MGCMGHYVIRDTHVQRASFFAWLCALCAGRSLRQPATIFELGSSGGNRKLIANLRSPNPNSVSGEIVTTDTKQRKMSVLQTLHASLMNLERLRREFPDFDITTLPPLPEGYLDASSYIDAAPSFENEERGLKVYVDYANYADRESGRSQRFCVSRYDEEAGDFDDVALSTNDWAEVTRFLTA